MDTKEIVFVAIIIVLIIAFTVIVVMRGKSNEYYSGAGYVTHRDAAAAAAGVGVTHHLEGIRTAANMQIAGRSRGVPRLESLSMEEQSSFCGGAETNPELGYYPADDYMQYHQTQPVSYDNYLQSAALDRQTMDNHRKWAEEAVPFSQTSMVVDDMDEATYMSTRQGHGFTTFRNDTPAQGAGTLFITEADPYLHATHSRPFRFQG